MYSKQIKTTLKNIIIFCRELDKTAGFYSDCIGLKVVFQSKQLIELKDQSNKRIILKKIENEAYNIKGYSPILNFSVENFEVSLQKAKDYGCIIDGEAIEDENFKIAFLKSPNGEMINILEQKEELNSDDDQEQVPQQEDKTSQEIKNILRKIKF